MKKVLPLVVALAFVTAASSQNWVSNAKFRDFDTYFHNLMQHLIYEIEDLGWWNLNLRDQRHDLNQEIYDRHFNGTVDYTNGFLVGIDHMDISNTMPNIAQGSVTFAITGSMRTLLRLHQVQLGYDVRAQFGELGDHRFTGIFNHYEIHFELNIMKNYNTSEISTSCWLLDLGTGSGNFMQYLPHNDIAEVLQRHYQGRFSWDGVADWCNTFRQSLLKLIDEDHLGFPEICFNC